MLTHDQKLSLVTQAARAPSAHNIQPARWRFVDDKVVLLEEPTRWLSVGDPTGRDNQIALGMAWEGMALALSALGLGLTASEISNLSYPPSSSGLRLVASGLITSDVNPDPLAALVDVRSSWRGKFLRATPPQVESLEKCAAAYTELITLVREEATNQIAKWYDDAAAEGLDNPRFAKELYHWLRLSPHDPCWPRDGLSADCMVLSRWEALGASIALKPYVVRMLSTLSLTGALVSESAKVKSATRIVLIHAGLDVTLFEIGRRWYRFWLDMTSRGIAGVPMSALADSSRHAVLLAESCRLPHGHYLVNAMRFGPTPVSGIPRSARLPTAELLL